MDSYFFLSFFRSIHYCSKAKLKKINQVQCTSSLLLMILAPNSLLSIFRLSKNYSQTLKSNRSQMSKLKVKLKKTERFRLLTNPYQQCVFSIFKLTLLTLGFCRFGQPKIDISKIR